MEELWEDVDKKCTKYIAYGQVMEIRPFREELTENTFKYFK